MRDGNAEIKIGKKLASKNPTSKEKQKYQPTINRIGLITLKSIRFVQESIIWLIRKK